MMYRPVQLLIVVIAVLILALPMLAACNGGDDDEEPTAPSATHTSQPSGPAEDVVITIGNLSDLTGPSSSAMSIIDMALEDLVGYYNEKNHIPGVELKVITYDGQTDPARDIPGYEWLRHKGADLIFTPVTAAPITLKPLVEQDGVVLFELSASDAALGPPGYVFSPTAPPGDLAYSILQWIAENDWDYQTRGPARIGAADWTTAWAETFQKAVENYAAVHPDQFEWVGGYQTIVGTMTWGTEVKALKDCDYLVPPTIMSTFVKEYRGAGHTGKFIGADPQAAFMGTIDDARLWDEIDGMLFVKSSRWWNEEGPLISLAKKLLRENHPGSAEQIMRDGSSYMAIDSLNQMLEIIADTVETAGAHNFNSQALYNAAVSYSQTVEGVERASFSETKRASINHIAVYEARAIEKDLFRLHPEWYPIVRSP